MDLTHEWFCGQVEANKTAMFRLARSILGRDADAEDAVAEAVLRGFTHLNSLQKQGSVKSWLMRITANESYRALSRQRGEMPLDHQIGDPAASQQGIDEGMSLWEHVKTLPETLRTPVVLFYYEDLTVGEIADILSLSPGAVKTRLSRARTLLRTRLQKEESQ